MLNSVPSMSKVVALCLTLTLVLLGGHLLYSQRIDSHHWPSLASKPVPEANGETVEVKHDLLPCAELPGAEDVAVIMRTGATEIEAKLPVHFNTTFRCYPNLIIFSDHEEMFHGHQVHDVLAGVDPEIKKANPDFEIYQRMQAGGREALHDDELSGAASFEGSKSGKKSNHGWKLDKWKFLPMMTETLKLQPMKKWYVFVESDSYIVWSNLLQLLPRLDSTKNLYYGSENQIGDDVFAHGGSSFIMSRSAVQIGSDMYQANPKGWHTWTNWHWAGDCVLGKALREAGVPLTWAWPILQGGHPEKMDFTEYKEPKRKLWCRPALSYHHFSHVEKERMWQFEQNWIQSRQMRAARSRRLTLWKDGSDVLAHRDVFKQFIWPNITTQRDEWNNLSPVLIPEPNISSFEACHDVCDITSDCLQYSYSQETGCSVSVKEVMLGQRWGGVRSGWMVDRVRQWMERLDECDGFEDWILDSSTYGRLEN